MRLQPIVYTTRMGQSVAWWSAVLGAEPAYQSEMWTSIPAGGATLGIHHVEETLDRGRVEISLVAEGSLEAAVERLLGAGIQPAEPIKEQPFGRSVLYLDPDGSPVQINEHRAST